MKQDDCNRARQRSSVWPAVIIALTLLLSLVACGESDSEVAEPEPTGETTQGEPITDDDAEPLKIGLAVSESGFNAAVSRDYLAGIEIWADMINNQTGYYADRDEAGLLGRPVELVHYDDESSPETALRIYERLISQDEVDFVLGPYGSGSTGVVAPVLESQGFAVIAAAASGEHLYTDQLDMMVMVPAPTSQYAAGLPDLVTEQGYESVAMVTVDNPFALSTAAWLNDQWTELGIDIVHDELFEIGQQDFTSIWTQVQNEDPDVVVLNAFGNDAVQARLQAEELGLPPEMWVVITGAWRNDVFVEGVGEDLAECTISDHHWLPDSGFSGSPEFAEAWIADHGDPRESGAGSDPAGAWGFAGGQVLTEGVDAVGEEALTDQAALVDWLKQAQFETVLGEFDVDPETGVNTGTKAMLVQFQDGERVLIAPEELAEGEPQLPCNS